MGCSNPQVILGCIYLDLQEFEGWVGGGAERKKEGDGGHVHVRNESLCKNWGFYFFLSFKKEKKGTVPEGFFSSANMSYLSLSNTNCGDSRHTLIIVGVLQNEASKILGIS